MNKKIDSFRGKYYFLSNFYSADIMYEGVTYENNEAAFQSAKTLDKEKRKDFSHLTPALAKKKGRNIQLRYDWEKVKYDIMLEVVRCKFNQNPELAQKLIDTRDSYLEEGNTWHDTTWGTYKGRGKNWLGKILMTVRDELK